MKISAKGQYAIAAMIYLAQNKNKEDYITVISIANELGISKIYLEQVFSLLRKADLVHSTKGSSGGYKLSKAINKITVYDILYAIGETIFEENKKSLSEGAKNIEKAIDQLIFKKSDQAIRNFFKQITLSDLLYEAEKNKDDENIMFYI